MRYQLAALVSRLHLPGSRRRLLADLALAAEQACDEQAADAGASRLQVAETILSVEKLFHLQSSPGLGLAQTSHFIGSNVADRVQSLLDAPRSPTRSLRLSLGVLAAAVIGLLLLAEPLHHSTESLLGYFFH